MRWHAHTLFVLFGWLPFATVFAGQQGSETPAPRKALPGSPAPEAVVAEIRTALDAAVARFAAMDETGVLDYVSPQYRTGPLTKAGIAEQLRAVFAIHDRVRARVRIDDVRIVGGLAWVYSTGDVTGRLRWVGGTVPVFRGSASWKSPVARTAGGVSSAISSDASVARRADQDAATRPSACAGSCRNTYSTHPQVPPWVTRLVSR